MSQTIPSKHEVVKSLDSSTILVLRSMKGGVRKVMCADRGKAMSGNGGRDMRGDGGRDMRGDGGRGMRGDGGRDMRGMRGDRGRGSQLQGDATRMHITVRIWDGNVVLSLRSIIGYHFIAVFPSWQYHVLTFSVHGFDVYLHIATTCYA